MLKEQNIKLQCDLENQRKDTEEQNEVKDLDNRVYKNYEQNQKFDQQIRW